MVLGGGTVLNCSITGIVSDVGKFKFESRVCEEGNRLGDGIVSADSECL